MHFNHIIMFVVTYLLHTPHHLLKVAYYTTHDAEFWDTVFHILELDDKFEFSSKHRHLHSKDHDGNIPRSI